jgi:hypothetical protein
VGANRLKRKRKEKNNIIPMITNIKTVVEVFIKSSFCFLIPIFIPIAAKIRMISKTRRKIPNSDIAEDGFRKSSIVEIGIRKIKCIYAQKRLVLPVK